MKKSFHKILGVSILPALLLMPAMAEDTYKIITTEDTTVTLADYNSADELVTSQEVTGNLSNVDWHVIGNDKNLGVQVTDSTVVFDGNRTHVTAVVDPVDKSGYSPAAFRTNGASDVTFSAKDTSFVIDALGDGTSHWGFAFDVRDQSKALFNGSGDVSFSSFRDNYTAQTFNVRPQAHAILKNKGNVNIDAKSLFGATAMTIWGKTDIDIGGNLIVNAGAAKQVNGEYVYDTAGVLRTNALPLQIANNGDISIKAGNVVLNSYGLGYDNVNFSDDSDGSVGIEIESGNLSVDSKRLDVNVNSSVALDDGHHYLSYGILFNADENQESKITTSSNTATRISVNNKSRAFGVNLKESNDAITFNGSLDLDINGETIAEGILLEAGKFESNSELNIVTNATETIGLDIADGAIASLNGTTSFTTNGSSADSVDIANAGVLNIGGKTTVEKGITGTGELNIAEGATLDIGTASITQGTINLGGTLIATLGGDATPVFTATEFNNVDDKGKLSLVFAKEGTYDIFANAKFDEAEEQVTSTIFDLDWTTNEGRTVIATKKSVEEIASGTGMNAESAVAISHIADVAAVEEAPAQLRELSVKLQEKLAGGDTTAVEHATKAIHPETESVSRSVSSSVQNTVVNIASARMALPAVGRNGGDVNLTSGGVWAQGLFNKSKQNDSFRGYTRGIAAGIDGTINKVWTIGAGYSFAHSDISGSARDTEIDSNTVFVYGQYKPSEWYVNAVANYTMSDYSEKGTVIDNDLVFADYDVDSFGGTIATGYDFANGITPELGLRYMHINTSDYTNTYGIKTSMKDTDFLTGMLGAKYAFNVAATKHLTFAPQLNAGVKYDFLSDKSASTVTMPGVDAYSLNGTRLNRFGSDFGIGLGMQYDALQVSLNYDIDVRKDYTSQTGMLKFRYNF